MRSWCCDVLSLLGTGVCTVGSLFPITAVFVINGERSDLWPLLSYLKLIDQRFASEECECFPASCGVCVCVCECAPALRLALAWVSSAGRFLSPVHRSVAPGPQSAAGADLIRSAVDFFVSDLLDLCRFTPGLCLDCESIVYWLKNIKMSDVLSNNITRISIAKYKYFRTNID